MSDDLRELYQEVILQHGRTPKNFRAIEDADRTIEAYNPLCGDHFTVYLKMDPDDPERIADVGFTGAGCAISTASASMMSEFLRGHTRAEAARLFEAFQRLVRGDCPGADAVNVGKLKVFGGVREYPARVKCAILAWHAAKAALEGEAETISTE